MSAGELDGLLGEFLVESHENLDQADRDFVALERDPTDRETLARIFRTVHTIKGSCGFLGLAKLEALAHSGESLMGRLRDGALLLDQSIATALLGMVDALRAALATIEETGGEGDADHAAIIAELDRLRTGDAAPAAKAPAPPGVRAPRRAWTTPRARSSPPPRAPWSRWTRRSPRSAPSRATRRRWAPWRAAWA